MLLACFRKRMPELRGTLIEGERERELLREFANQRTLFNTFADNGRTDNRWTAVDAYRVHRCPF